MTISWRLGSAILAAAVLLPGCGRDAPVQQEQAAQQEAAAVAVGHQTAVAVRMDPSAVTAEAVDAAVASLRGRDLLPESMTSAAIDELEQALGAFGDAAARLDAAGAESVVMTAGGRPGRDGESAMLVQAPAGQAAEVEAALRAMHPSLEQLTLDAGAVDGWLVGSGGELGEPPASDGDAADVVAESWARVAGEPGTVAVVALRPTTAVLDGIDMALQRAPGPVHPMLYALQRMEGGAVGLQLGDRPGLNVHLSFRDAEAAQQFAASWAAAQQLGRIAFAQGSSGPLAEHREQLTAMLDGMTMQVDGAEASAWVDGGLAVVLPALGRARQVGRAARQQAATRPAAEPPAEAQPVDMP